MSQRIARSLGPVASCSTHFLVPDSLLDHLLSVPPKILGVATPTSFAIALNVLLLTRASFYLAFIE